MNIPAQRTVKHDIGSYVYRKPGVTFEAIACAMQGRRKHFLRTQVDEMLFDGLLIWDRGGLMCCLKLRQYFEQSIVEDQANPRGVLPPYRPAFKPYKPAPLMTREPLREMSFVVLASNVAISSY
jgi:hypothetical protein